MANTGLFRLFIVGLLFGSALGGARPDPLSSRSWINSQKFKRSDSNSVLHLSHGSDDIDRHAGLPLRQVDPSLMGGITLTGPPSRLGDFHQTSSSWKIVGCTTKPTAQQKVLAYCTGADPLADCAGIFVGGAKHTIVKLPEGCGASPFARVVRFAPTKRSLPLSERKGLGKQKVSVFELIFDYQFARIPYKKGDMPVEMHMEYTNIRNPAAAPGFRTMRPYNSWHADFASGTFENNNTIPIDHDFSGNMATLSQQCVGFSMSLEMDVVGNINGSINYGYYVAGTIVPPQISDHYAYLDATSFVTTQLNMTGMIQYTFTAVTVPILPAVGLPGLSYPGLLNIGPYFEINAGISGKIAVAGSMTTNTGFSIPSVHISVGNSSTPQSNAGATDFANVALSNEIQLSAGLTFALTPQVGVQLSVLDGIVDADVNLQPSAGITAGGSIDINTQNGNVTDPCVELDGELDLNWGVGGKLGPWGAAVTGRIWGLEKKLWSHCFNSGSRKRSIAQQSDWKLVDDSAPPPMRFTELLSLTCPAVNPFGNSTSP